MTRALWMPACLLGMFLASSVSQAQTGTCNPAAAGVVPYYHQLPQAIFYAQCSGLARPDKPADGDTMTAAECLRLWQILWSLGKYEEAHALADQACQASPGNVDLEHARALAQIIMQHAAQRAACCPVTGCHAATAGCCKTASQKCPTVCGTCPCEANCCSEACESCCAETTCTASGCCKKKCCCDDKCACGKDCRCAKKTCCKDCCCAKAACACGPNCACCKKTCACGPNCACCKKTCACGPNCACCKKSCACGPDCACCKKTCACGASCACKAKGHQERLVRHLKALQKLVAERCQCIGMPGLPCAGMSGCALPEFTAPLPAPMMICPEQTVMEMPLPPPYPGMPYPGMPYPGMPCPPMIGLPGIGMPPCVGSGVCSQPVQMPVPTMPVSRPMDSNMTPCCPPACCPPCPAVTAATPANREPIEITAKGGRVHILAPRFQATCDHLTYQESSDQVILTGAVRLSINNGSGKDKIRAERVQVGVHHAEYQVTPNSPSSEVRRERKPDASPCSTFKPKACWPTCPCK